MRSTILTLAACVLSLPVQAQPANPQDSKAGPRSLAGMRNEKALNSYVASDMLIATSQARNAIRFADKADALIHADHAIQNADELLAKPDGKFVEIFVELSQFAFVRSMITANREPRVQQPQAPQSRTLQEQNPRIEGEAERSANPAASNPAISVQPRSQATGPQQPQMRSGQERDPEILGQSTLTIERAVDEYTRVTLDVQAAKDHLQTAQRSLNEGNFESADAALAAVTDVIRVSSVVRDLPLLRARQNLALARDSAARGEMRQRDAALKAASDALAAYQAAAGQPNQAIGKLQADIKDFGTGAGRTAEQAAGTIEGWWEAVGDFMTEGPQA